MSDVQISIDASCWSNGRGYGRYTRELVSQMVADFPDHEFTLFADEQTTRQCKMPPRARIETVDTRRQSTQAASFDGFRSPLDLWRMRSAVSRCACDVFFFPASYSFFPIPRRIPTVVTIHDAIVERFPQLTLPSRRSRLFWNIKTRLALRQATRIITVSEAARAAITCELHCAASQIEVIPEAPGLQFRVIDDARAVSVARDRCKLPADVPLLLYVGGISPHKNLETLLRALAQPRLTSKAWHVVMVGDYEHDRFLGCYKDVSSLCRDLGLVERVTFTGFVPDEDLVLLYNAATMLIVPSLDEGFGLPAVEAMACGLPVAASSRGSLPEVVGGAGRFFDPLNPSEMGEVIGSLLKDAPLRSEFRARALEQVSRFSWSSAARQTIRLLEETARAAAGA